MKRILALVLAAVMMLSVVVIVSADETKTGDAAAAGIQNFEFEDTDARNMFDNQVIYIERIAAVAPIVDGDVSIVEYDTHVTLNQWNNADNKAQGHFSYKDGYLYFAVVKEGVDANYDIQIDVGNAAENHPYAVAADRFNQRIKADSSIANASYGMFRDDSAASWSPLGGHPWKDAGVNPNFIEEGFNGIVDGNLVIEAKLNVLTIMKFFAGADKYRNADTEYGSQAIAWMIWLDNITNQFCVKGDDQEYKKTWGTNTVTWDWVMHTIVLPEKPASRFVTKTPAGEMKFEDNDARNLFEKMSKEDTDPENDILQVLTVSKIADTLPTVDGIVGTGEYVDKYEIVIFNNTDRKAQMHMSYKDGYLYMGVQMPAGAEIATQVDMGIGESSSPYTTVNRTTHQIKADGSLGGSGQLIRCNDQAAWNVRGTHPSGTGAAFVDKAATSFADGLMTFEYVVDTVRLIKWFATHEAYYDWDTVLATRCVMWQIWGPEANDGTKATQTQYCVPSVCAYFDIFWPGQTITWNWAKHTIVLPEAPASHLEKYVEPPYDPDKDLNKIDVASKKWNDLVYTVDFSGDDGYYIGSHHAGSNTMWTVTPTTDGKGIEIVGKGGDGSNSGMFWGGVIGGLDVDNASYYTLVYKARANDRTKNNSLNVGSYIPEGKAHALKHTGLYTNHNTDVDPRGCAQIGANKAGDKTYQMFKDLPSKWAEDNDGFMTVMIEYDFIDGLMSAYYLAEGKTGAAKEDWVLIKTLAIVAGQGDMMGFMVEGCYDCINTTIKDVSIYKGTYYKSAEKVPVVTTTEPETTTVTETETTTTAPVESETTTAPVESETTTAPVESETTTVGGGETETTTVGGGDDTTAGTTEPETTTAGTTGGDTEKKGCGSSIVSSMVVLAIIGCGAVVASKKRK